MSAYYDTSTAIAAAINEANIDGVTAATGAGDSPGMQSAYVITPAFPDPKGGFGLRIDAVDYWAFDWHVEGPSGFDLLAEGYFTVDGEVVAADDVEHRDELCRAAVALVKAFVTDPATMADVENVVVLDPDPLHHNPSGYTYRESQLNGDDIDCAGCGDPLDDNYPIAHDDHGYSYHEGCIDD